MDGGATQAEELPAAPSAPILSPGGLLDLFCGMAGLSAGFRKAGYTPLAGVDSDARLAEAYGKNFPGAEVVVGDATDRRLMDRLVERYGVGGSMLGQGEGGGWRPSWEAPRASG